MRLIILIFSFIVLSQCNTKTTAIKRQQNDTLKTLCVFENSKSERTLDYMYRIITDTIMVDSMLKATLTRDTIYYTPFVFPAIDSTGKQQKDSLGKLVYDIQYVLTPKKKIIWSAEKNIDSLLKK